MRPPPLPPQLPKIALQGGREEPELPQLRVGWRTLLLASVVTTTAAAIMALSLSTADYWDTHIDRFFYATLLLSNTLVVLAVRRGAWQVASMTHWMLLGCALWLMTKLVLVLLFIGEPQALLRELTESMVWLPTMLSWGLMTSISLKTPQLLWRTVLALLLVCLGGGLVWTLRWGWHPDVLQGLFQLMLSATTGYLGMEYFLKRVEVLRYGQGEREALSRLAYTDLLTGLPNRLRLEQELERRIAAAEEFAVVFVDVDSFKVINDTLGHEAGDALLEQVADLLQRSTGEIGSDGKPAPLPRWPQTFRLSGDEFVVLLPGAGEEEALALAQQWQGRLFDLPHIQGGGATTLSVGISLCPEDATTAEELLRHADSAMYAVKNSGRGQVRRYQSEYDAQTERFQQLARALGRPGEEEGFSLAYQPICDLHTRQPVKVETLLRWHHPHLGQVSPAEFIPISERTGQINQIGRWVLEEACRTALAWPQLILSVNVSAVQLIRADYAERVQETLERIGFPASRLELELTETAALHEDPRIHANLEKLHRLGIGISLDDFGAGYSNLSRLSLLQLKGIKLDRSLVHNLPDDSGEFSRLLVQVMVLLAREERLCVTAEGLETAAHVEAAGRLGCHLGQGYALSYPLTAAQVTELLQLDAPASPAPSVQSAASQVR